MARATLYGTHKHLVLEEVHRRELAHATAPTVRELADLLEVSPATMHSWLLRLADEDLIQWTPRHHRSLRLTDPGLATVTAGSTT